MVPSEVMILNTTVVVEGYIVTLRSFHAVYFRFVGDELLLLMPSQIAPDVHAHHRIGVAIVCTPFLYNRVVKGVAAAAVCGSISMTVGGIYLPHSCCK